MSDTSGGASERIILKVLSGLQTGAEVSLVAGEYGVGSGPDDDLQFVDVSLKPGHARLRVAAGKIQVSGRAGSLKTSNGLVVAAGSDDWQEIEPLEVVTAGTTRFALGPPTANWATITDAEDIGPTDPLARRAGAAAAKARSPAETEAGWSRLAGPLVAVLVAAGLGAAWYTFGMDGASRARVAETRSDQEIVRAALDQFPFGRPVEVRREVDGTLYANGYVETAAERRALTAALEKTGVPVHARLWVLTSLRQEVDNLVASRRLKLQANLTKSGDLSLEGVVLSQDAADRVVSLVRDTVFGLKTVESRIRTAPVLLKDVERLARQSQIDGSVLFRLDADLIEATGFVTLDKVDAWVGFLQAYGQRFAADIGLRSFVQLQGNPGRNLVADPRMAQRGITIGPQASGDTSLDLDRLRQGLFDLSDVFVGLRKTSQPAPGAAEAAADAARPVARVVRAEGATPRIRFTDLVEAPAAATPAAAPEPVPAPQPAGTTPQPAPKPAEAAPATPDRAVDLSRTAQSLIDAWRRGRLNGPGQDRTLSEALSTLDRSLAREGGADALTRLYGPLLAERLQPRTSDGAPCWPGAQLSAHALPGVLLWLDLLSVSDAMTISSFDRPTQVLLLEAALNPGAAAACARAIDAASRSAALATGSLYLRETRANPDFVRFVTRDLTAYKLDVTGVSVGRDRFLQVRDGRKLPEGSAPDPDNRLAVIGELGSALQGKERFAIIIYGQDVNWLVAN
ncbi:FHA domain-containing protein [Prosthecomicrobium sp. N25]|uniref:FHA domain-containing protein n=1 Tax=Prosthecomicrobium sp. N25 TaxID=3129254 RepID=UPI0030778152